MRAMQREIGEKRRRAEAHAAEMECVQLAIDRASAPLLIADAHGQIIYANAAARLMQRRMGLAELPGAAEIATAPGSRGDVEQEIEPLKRLLPACCSSPVLFARMRKVRTVRTS